MSPAINFAKVTGLEPLPAGNYTATIVQAEVGISKAGNEKIDLQWKVEGGPHDGRVVFDTMTFTEKALFRVKATLQGLGYPKDFKGEVRPADLIGKTAKLTLDIQPGNGVDESGEPYQARNRVKKVKVISTR
jgi:hypothetical protein